ncbi:hypothetical protein JG626_17490 [Vibrio cholerae]|uniref:hypothetical protein n=1 Tax=Vibrio cholerae TaxID=666 RepID=UPI0018F06A74|nr:hypothetical protein [Vibrio cholerae]EKF9596310.1 hypothetical protein [Vibrio cholerae]MBJ6934193.1 hypothetical protein [Vibrio cholerae]
MLMIIGIVLALIILTKSGVAESVILLFLSLAFSYAVGVGVSAISSFIFTPIVGMPLGIIAGIIIFFKLMSR